MVFSPAARYNRCVNKLQLHNIVRMALDEDLGYGDLTTSVVPGSDKTGTGRFLAKADGVLCGVEVATLCFTTLDSTATYSFTAKDGDTLANGSYFGEVTAPATTLLSAERVALNFMQRLSGIATLARSFAVLAEPLGIRIVETRKTTPGLRMLEKYAVLVGSGHNHRMGLDSCVMLKDNHFALAGCTPSELVKSVKAKISHTMKIVAEAATPEMVAPLVEAGTDIVMFDNFTPDEVRKSLPVVDGRATIELSGGINEDNLVDYLIPGVDVISIGALTHSYKSLDISLEV